MACFISCKISEHGTIFSAKGCFTKRINTLPKVYISQEHKDSNKSEIYKLLQYAHALFQLEYAKLSLLNHPIIE